MEEKEYIKKCQELAESIQELIIKKMEDIDSENYKPILIGVLGGVFGDAITQICNKEEALVQLNLFHKKGIKLIKNMEDEDLEIIQAVKEIHEETKNQSTPLNHQSTKVKNMG